MWTNFVWYNFVFPYWNLVYLLRIEYPVLIDDFIVCLTTNTYNGATD